MKKYLISVTSDQTGRKITFPSRSLTRKGISTFCYDVVKFFYVESGHTLYVNLFTIVPIRLGFEVCVTVDVDTLTTSESVHSFHFTFIETNV